MKRLEEQILLRARSMFPGAQKTSVSALKAEIRLVVTWRAVHCCDAFSQWLNSARTAFCNLCVTFCHLKSTTSMPFHHYNKIFIICDKWVQVLGTSFTTVVTRDQILFRLGLSPDPAPCYGSLQRSPDSLAGFKGVLLRGGRVRRRNEEGKKGMGR